MTVEASVGTAPPSTYTGPDATGLAGPSSDESQLKAFNDDDGPSFSDLLDIINPLQHIPVINTIYQHLTGDKEGAVADVVGGALWGGVIGLGAAVANLVVEDQTGKSLGDHVYALFVDDDADTQMAEKGEDGGQTAQAATKGQSAAAAQAPSEPVKLFNLDKAAARQAANGPTTVGDFLVFGAAAQPTVGSAAPQMLAVAAVAAGPATSGDFLVFGANQNNASQNNGGQNADDEQAAQTKITPQSLTPPSADPDTVTATAAQTAALAAQQGGRAFPIPARRVTTTPRQNLPLPTTGPAAVPGNMRTVSPARAALGGDGAVIGSTAGNGSEGAAGANQTDQSWFVNAFNQAMDKYNRAAGLGDNGTSTPPPTNGQTAASLMQMN